MFHRFYLNRYVSLGQWLKQSSFLTNPDFEDFAGAGQTEIITATVAQQPIKKPNKSTDNGGVSSTDSIKDHDQGVRSNHGKDKTKEEARSNKKIKKAVVKSLLNLLAFLTGLSRVCMCTVHTSYV